MFNKKKILNLEKKVNKFEKWFDEIEEVFDSIKEVLDNIVSCGECGVAIKKDKAQKVEIGNFHLYYCQKHKKPYDKLEKNAEINSKKGTLDFYTKYYKSNVEVNKKGKQIKKSNK